MKYKIGDKVNNIEELRQSWAEDPGRWYRTGLEGNIKVISWPRLSTCSYLYQKDDFSLSGVIEMYVWHKFPYTIIPDPTESEDARLCREHGIEAGQWVVDCDCLLYWDGKEAKTYNSFSSLRKHLAHNAGWDKEQAIKYGKKIDPVEYINQRVKSIYDRSTKETAVADMKERYRLLDRSLEIGMIKHGDIQFRYDNCPLCKAQGKFTRIDGCGDCTLKAALSNCCKELERYVHNPKQETWRALYDRIMSLEDEPKPEVKRTFAWEYLGTGELPAYRGVSPDQIIVDRAEWEQCQLAKKAFEGGAK